MNGHFPIGLLASSWAAASQLRGDKQRLPIIIETSLRKPAIPGISYAIYKQKATFCVLHESACAEREKIR